MNRRKKTDLTRKKRSANKSGKRQILLTQPGTRSFLVRLVCLLLCPYNKLQGRFILSAISLCLDGRLKNITGVDGGGCRLFSCSCCSSHGLLVQTTVFAATLCINGIPISKRTWGLQRILICKEDFRFANQDTTFWLCKSLVWKALFSCLTIYFVRLEDHLKKCVLSLLLHRRAMWWISQFKVVILPCCCSLLDGCLAVLWLLWTSRSRSNKNLSTLWVWFPSQAFHV